jgi:hypothetical protein
MLKLKKRLTTFTGFATAAVMAWSCAPQRPYRTPLPPSSAPAPTGSRGSSQSPVTPPPAAPVESARNPIQPESKIREQDIRGTPAPAAAPKDVKEPARQASIGEPRGSGEATPAPLPPPLADDSSLLAKITPGISPQRAASLRLTEEGRKLLDAGDPAKALTRLERTIVIDSTNGYGYFYLAKAQQRLGHYQESLNLLEIAQSRLGAEPFWMSELYALRGENYRALGQIQKAETSYHQSLRLNSGNRTASDALARIAGDAPAASK